ncbi:uncharacterized protein MAM_06433 [Metarhizium album ARSEF 1941]|uniref:DUF3106 domain-containing protein n=1 Tax=Metarhizium album (strain ARSEF 1941) TaxID=1081103 RepID=A0A0B2WIG6_METAS|nr:uncharacterized protein MAM_06433 [Metarhizium album ARSEF 1941]KHN95821.1 hypothetical protein MAM_06433 [Metarhizium album ARSEF 1941]
MRALLAISSCLLLQSAAAPVPVPAPAPAPAPLFKWGEFFGPGGPPRWIEAASPPRQPSPEMQLASQELQESRDAQGRGAHVPEGLFEAQGQGQAPPQRLPEPDPEAYTPEGPPPPPRGEGALRKIADSYGYGADTSTLEGPSPPPPPPPPGPAREQPWTPRPPEAFTPQGPPPAERAAPRKPASPWDGKSPQAIKELWLNGAPETRLANWADNPAHLIWDVLTSKQRTLLVLENSGPKNWPNLSPAQRLRLWQDRPPLGTRDKQKLWAMLTPEQRETHWQQDPKRWQNLTPREKDEVVESIRRNALFRDVADEGIRRTVAKIDKLAPAELRNLSSGRIREMKDAVVKALTRELWLLKGPARENEGRPGRQRAGGGNSL